ncbi:hypothetical protein ACQP1V_43205 (plasmid) [Microtetraspora malaysiensis]|uniref:hypothetical protein n=1 Tax=Microtetraspora malaysiensis TaxID=161358 RepID=UPI003D8DF594
MAERRPSYGDRQFNATPRRDGMKCVDGQPHAWKPVSFVFETQLLDKDGRVLVRQPAITAGRVYLVCLGCCSHTYAETDWVGYTLGGPERRDPTLMDEEDTSDG